MDKIIIILSMRQIIIVIALLMFINLSVNAEPLPPERCDKIFNSLPQIIVKYDFDEDPIEYKDYEKFAWSPYPLIRISEKLYLPKTTVNEGYYLLTPRSHEGTDCVLFKQKGRIKAIIPVYAVELIPPDKINEVYKIPPPPKTHWWGLPWRGVKFVCKKIFIHTKKGRPFPLAMVDTYEAGPAFYQMDLYYENHIYKMLFKTHN